MKRSVATLFYALFFALLLAGCESYPLGMSKEEWQLLSPEQKAHATREQAAIDAEQRRLAAEEDARRREAEAAEAAHHEEQIAARYRHARYGDIVSVNIDGGTFRFDGDDRTYEPVAFDIVRGESKQIIIRRDDKRKYTISVMVRLSEDGRKLYFDDSSDKSLTLTEKTWDRGQTYPIAIHNNKNSDPRNVTFTIRYRPIRYR